MKWRHYSKKEAVHQQQRSCLTCGKHRLRIKIFHRRWLKNEKWLSDYKEKFEQSYMSSNPFFKVERREQATYAELTAQPMKKSPTYAEVTRRPKTKTHFNRQSTSTTEQQQKHQPNLEAIQILLQQVQSQMNFQAAPRQQPKLKKTDRQTNKTKSILIRAHRCEFR